MSITTKKAEEKSMISNSFANIHSFYYLFVLISMCVITGTQGIETMGKIEPLEKFSLIFLQMEKLFII